MLEFFQRINRRYPHMAGQIVTFLAFTSAGAIAVGAGVLISR